MSEILPAKTALADIETTAITYDEGGVIVYPSRVHIIVAHDLERDLTHVFGPDEESLRRGVKFLEESTLVVFHNGIGFDVPVLEKVFGFKVRDDRHVVDSLVLCQLFYSNIKEEEDFSLFEKHKKLPNSPTKFTGNLVGKHSLEAWGLRLNPPYPKGTYAEDMEILEIDPWAEWTPEMQTYAIQDVMVLKALWTQRLASRYADASNKDAVAVEHYMTELMDNVKRTGIRFDKEAAETLVAELEARSESLVQEINEAFPARLEPVKWVFDPIPLGMPALDESDRAEYETLRRQDDERSRKRCAELENSGPQQRLTRLMFEHSAKDIYRPRFNLPDGYLREWWGEVFTPKVTRTVKDKAGNVLYVAEKGCPFVKVAWTPLNPGSRQQIIRRLLELGWTPTEFTESGLPELSEVELHKIEEEFPVASVIAKYLLIQKRLGQIKTGDKAWLNLIDPSSFIHPTIRACSTVTFRATHSDPNVSQVPSVKMKDAVDSSGNKIEKTSKKTLYTFKHGAWTREETDDIEKKVKQIPLLGEAGKWGWECRACFTVPEGFRMVGADLAGIEMRAWAHYLWKYDGGSFADVVLNKDVHEENRVILGFNDRRKAKEFLYALMYGAGDEKLGFIIDPQATPERQKQLGAAARSRFMSGLSGYEQLNNELMFGVKRGWLKGIDGRRVPVRKQHAALNSLLQSTGAIISKYWIIYTLSILENEGHLEWGYDKDFSLLLYSHDELQFACRPDKVEFVQQACAKGALKAGERLKFRLPVEVGLASGVNWAETH